MSQHRIHVAVNGTGHSVEVEERLLLVHLLRGVLGLTDTPVGCDTTHCGSCSVLLDGAPARACSLTAVQVDGREVTTVAGVRGEQGQPHPLHEVLAEELDVQCDYCPPGIIVTAAALLARNPFPDEDEICDAIAGNLCRCLVYDQIIRAIQRAGERLAEQASSDAVHRVEIASAASAGD